MTDQNLLNLQADIKTIIDANCVHCHSEFSNYSGLKTVVDNGYFKNEVIQNDENKSSI